jgi:hypothetical protein
MRHEADRALFPEPSEEDAKQRLILGQEKEAARVFYASRPGGLFRIDQEVVTLRGLPGNSGLSARPERRTESNPNSPVVCGL